MLISMLIEDPGLVDPDLFGLCNPDPQSGSVLNGIDPHHKNRKVNLRKKVSQNPYSNQFGPLFRPV